MPRRPHSVIHVVIYSRPGCHLCDEMKALVARTARSIPIAIEEIDISTDRDLEKRYGLEIPVLMIEGKKIAKYRIGEDELKRALAARAGQAGWAGKAGWEEK